MKAIVIGAHLLRDDIEPFAEAFPAGELYLSGMAIPEERPLGDRDLLLQVASVRSKLLEIATFIAIRYGLTIASAEEARARCGEHLERWKRLLVEHRNEVEIVLKTRAAESRTRPDRHDFSSGAAYLKALHEVTRGTEPDSRLEARAEQLLLPLATRHRWIRRDEKSLELALLVRRSSLEQIRSAGDLLREELTDVPFLISGPWPLEVFADDDHE